MASFKFLKVLSSKIVICLDKHTHTHTFIYIYIYIYVWHLKIFPLYLLTVETHLNKPSKRKGPATRADQS